MSWFGGSNNELAEMEKKISDATSEEIPNGEIDLPIALEITDIIRSKKVPAKQCMRALKKRLQATFTNPNLLSATLKLVDLCVKNAGYHFLVELSSKEFMDYLVDFIFKANYNTHDSKVVSYPPKLAVGEQILTLIQNWQLFFKSQLQLSYVEKCYKDLLRNGYTFPDSDNSGYLNGNFIDTETPADWVDGDECMICYKGFSMLNRQHHCRSCGGVFCQEHSSHNAPLVALGIKEPVRVCDNCYYKIRLNNRDNLQKVQTDKAPASSTEDEDEELRKAIELSLQEAGVKVEPPKSPPKAAGQPPTGDDDEAQMKAAIAASLQEFESQKKRQEQYQPAEPKPSAEPQAEFYPNFTPFSERQQNSYEPPRQNLPPAAHIEMHTPQFGDLTSEEEDMINKYISLMNEIQTDRARQGRILYDKEINELHSEIIRLKPKLNKSLRNAIERYDAFVALNNKISTITRLYDQFLESKLTQAYGSHSIGPNYGYNYQPAEDYQRRYSNGYVSNQTPPEIAGVGQASFAPPQNYTGSPQRSRIASQSTGPPLSAGVSSQHTGFNPQHSGVGVPQQRKYSQAGEVPSQSSEEHHPVYPSDLRQQIPQQYNAPPPAAIHYPLDYGSQPSDPDVYEQPSRQNMASEPDFPLYNGESEPNLEESEPQYNNISAYPPIERIPSSSPGDYIPQTYEQPDYTTSYPPEDEHSQFEQNYTGTSTNSANSRYPPIDVITAEYDKTAEVSMPQTTFPSAPSQKPAEPPVKKFVEEPLIEL